MVSAGSNEADEYQMESMQYSAPVPTTQPTNEPFVSRIILKPSTEKLRSNDLLKTSDAMFMRRLRSTDALHATP